MKVIMVITPLDVDKGSLPQTYCRATLVEKNPWAADYNCGSQTINIPMLHFLYLLNSEAHISTLDGPQAGPRSHV